MNLFADIIDWAMKAGTLPMQALMLLGLIILGWVIVYLHKQSNRKIEDLHKENRANQSEWEKRIEGERTAMSQERRDRINMLLEVLREDTKVKAELTNAIENNTKAIERFEELLERRRK